MDKDGDGKVSKAEFQNEVGVEKDEVQDRFVEKFPGGSEEAMKAADKDGDGKVSEAELQKVMEDKLGLTPENAKKAAKEMMKDLDPKGTGSISGADFKDATKAKADDMANKIEEKLGSSAEAMKAWDKDGDGKMSEEEFLAGAKETGISPDAAKDMWKAQDKDGDGEMSADDFGRAFGMGPDDVMERMFQHFGNPDKAFAEMDKNHDGILDLEEWKAGAVKMKLKPDQVERIFKDMDSNHKESTQGGLSKWELFNYLDYEVPSFRTHGDGYGDIDAFGSDHKKFNELPNTHGAAAAAAAVPTTKLVHSLVTPATVEKKTEAPVVVPVVAVPVEQVPKAVKIPLRALDKLETLVANDPLLKAKVESGNKTASGFLSPKDVAEHHNLAIKDHRVKKNRNKHQSKKHHH